MCSSSDVSGFWTVCPGDVPSQITASRVQTVLQLSQKAEASDLSTQNRKQIEFREQKSITDKLSRSAPSNYMHSQSTVLRLATATFISRSVSSDAQPTATGDFQAALRERCRRQKAVQKDGSEGDLVGPC